ncbi:RDD family protein [Mariniblastus sp.]|nr:RDD family protein [Mariniblastus sp.]
MRLRRAYCEDIYLMASVNLNSTKQRSRASSLPAPPAEKPALDTATRVMTPENIAFEYQLAGPFRRIVAYVADILISLVGFGIFAFVIWMGFLFLFDNTFVTDELWGLLAFMTLVAWFLIYWFYGAVAETYMNGQTFGKRICSLRVMTVDGHAIDGVQATLRNFFRLLDMAPVASIPAMLGAVPEAGGLMTPTCLIGLIAMTINKRYQRIGDMVAGTMVIHEEPRTLSKLAEFSDPRVASLAELIPPTFVVSAKLSRAISEYVDSRGRLAPQRANEIAVHVAQPLLQRFGIPTNTDADLFVCALYFRTFAGQPSDDELTTTEPARSEPTEPAPQLAVASVDQATEAKTVEVTATEVTAEDAE